MKERWILKGSALKLFLASGKARFGNAPLARRFASAAAWSIIGAGVSRGLGLAVSVISARLLGKEVFGQLGILQSTLGMFGIIAGFGLGLTASKHIAEFKSSDVLRAGRVLTMSSISAWLTGAVATGLLVLCAPWLASKSLAAPHLVLELRICALLVLFGAVGGAQAGVLAGFEAFKEMAHISVVTGLASFGFVTAGCWFWRLPGNILGLVAAATISCVLNYLTIVKVARQHGVPLWSHDWWRELSMLWTFSLPAVLASLLVTPTLWLCQTKLVSLPHGYQGMAEYAVGVQWRTFVQYVPGVLCSAYLPVAASLAAGNRRKLMLANLGIVFILSAGAAAIIMLFSDLIFSAYGSAFKSMRWILALLLVAGVADSVNSILLQTLMASGRAWLRLISNVVWASVLICISYATIPRYGALGLSLAVSAAQCVHLCVQIPLTLYYAERKDPQNGH